MGASHMSGPLFVGGRKVPDYSSFPSVGRTVYVDPQGYLNGPWWDNVEKYSTMTDAFNALKGSPVNSADGARGSTIVLYGKLREDNVTTPKGLTDVTIIGAQMRPRSGNTTNKYGPKSGAANWGQSASPAGPTLTVNQQGWAVLNIEFGGGSTYAAIKLVRDAGSGNDEQIAGHFLCAHCTFTGGIYGIEDAGGNNEVHVLNNLFYGHNGAAGHTAIKGTSAGQAFPLMWEIRGNRFIDNKNDVVLLLSNGTIKNNQFFWKGFTTTNVVAIDLSAGGKNNIVSENDFSMASNEAGIASTRTKGGTADQWGPNYCTDAVKYGVPTG